MCLYFGSLKNVLWQTYLEYANYFYGPNCMCLGGWKCVCVSGLYISFLLLSWRLWLLLTQFPYLMTRCQICLKFSNRFQLLHTYMCALACVSVCVVS